MTGPEPGEPAEPAKPAKPAAPALALEGIDKAFDGIAALTGADLAVHWGEVHGLLGENGAGKSTLMNIVCGLYSADAGKVSLDGREVRVRGPADATRRGIGMVHQHFKLVAPFTVAENVLLACGAALPSRTVAAAGEAIAAAAAELGFAVDAHANVAALSVAEQQRVEILKLVILGADILVLDEPTSVLTDDEADAVLRLLRRMADAGKAVVLITHRLREVIDHADRVTVMRGGRTVAAGAAAAGLDADALARLMVGETIGQPYPPRQAEDGNQEPRLEIAGLSVHRADGGVAVDDVSLAVHGGEIVGIAGVGGNGQTELTEALYGLLKPSGGTVRIDGRDASALAVAGRRRGGLRLIPADRYAYALLPDLLAYENLAISGVPLGRFGSRWWLDRPMMRRRAREAFADNQIVGGRPETRTRLFSGGNAQKLLLARELAEDPAVLVAHSPTRGLDVRACQAVHETVVRAVEAGAACLLISEDLDEVLRLSTRIGVMSRGRIEGPFPAREIARAEIGALMAGHA